MSYIGTIIEESLKDKSILNEVKILSTKEEKVTEKHQTPHLKQWTMHKVEVPEGKAQEIAEIIGENIDTSHGQNWYIDYKNDDWHYVIYPNKVFKIDRTSREQYQEATDYGISIGIPDYQVDFLTL